MLANMAISLIMHKRINTTVAKAKALRKYVEPLINRSKQDTTASRRVVFSYLQNKYAVTELFQVISEKVAERPGGYTRIIKTGFRQGDNAATCFIELVDFDENMAKTQKKAKRTRRSSSVRMGRLFVWGLRPRLWRLASLCGWSVLWDRVLAQHREGEFRCRYEVELYVDEFLFLFF